MLLSHVNPYTGSAYAAEPAVALVEINNENSLFFEWNNGRLDTIASPYRDELSTLWTQALERNHGSDEKIRTAWSQGTRANGPDLLTNGDFARGTEGWTIEQHEGTTAKGHFDRGRPAVDDRRRGQTDLARTTRAGQPQAGSKYGVSPSAFVRRQQRPTESPSRSRKAHAPWTCLRLDVGGYRHRMARLPGRISGSGRLKRMRAW
jgi:hypothetical protein